jgi:hypothetical protein
LGEKLQPRTDCEARKSGTCGTALPAIEGACHTRTQEQLPSASPVEDRPRDQGRRRHHEARRPDEADPLEVRQDLGVELGHGDQFVSGQR